MEFLLTPPIAFLLYIPLVVAILLVGRALAGPEKSTLRESGNYSSGELAPTQSAAPGYRPFFMVAFFFAILHLGMLVLGTGELNGSMAVYIVGLALALVALILG